MRIEVNRDKAADLGIPIETIGEDAGGIAQGGRRTTMFMREGKGISRHCADAGSTPRDASDIEQLQVRGAQSDLIPLSNLVTVREAVAPKQLNHYEKLRAVTISASVDSESYP